MLEDEGTTRYSRRLSTNLGRMGIEMDADKFSLQRPPPTSRAEWRGARSCPKWRWQHRSSAATSSCK